MPALGLALFALYGALAFGLRMTVQLRRTGATGFAGLRSVSGSMEWICGSLLTIAVLLGIAGPVLQLSHALSPVAALDGGVADVLGAVLAALGIAGTVAAQFAMGDAWRIGVDASERTELVSDGPFSIVRNPIFAAMIPAFTGVALLAPNAATIAAAVVLVAALELQTRLVEEPYLAAVHGERYAVYAAKAGRFLPGVGRLRLEPTSASGAAKSSLVTRRSRRARDR
jgi:protein-S-isoprenylcysteine O-methyltransferase Ste14